jgi:uncharacterized metal-binding protein YceD (DUF177 family)
LSQPQYIVRLADLERGKKDFEWELPPAWLVQCFADTEATPQGPGTLRIQATQPGGSVLIRGQAQAKVVMPCARTTDPVDIDLRAEVFLLLRQEAPVQDTSAGQGGAGGKRGQRPGPQQPSVPAQKQRPIHRAEVELSETDAADETFTGDHIELDSFVREFLILELPMMPLRSDLRSEERPAIPPTPESPEGNESSRPIDPRLRPLAEIASRLRKTKE